MALTVNTNVASLNAQRNLSKAAGSLNKSMERLSTGLRINRSADDAAGMAISNTLRAHIRSINQASRNANDAVSMLQIAEGAMSEMDNILSRMRELSQQASNGSLASTERGYLNDEYVALKSELIRISDVTEFMGTKLLNGSLSAGVNFQVGYKNSSNDRVSFTMKDTDVASLGLNTTGANNISTAAAAQSAMAVIDASALNVLADRKGTIGALQNRLEYTISNLASASENFSAADSRIRDADFAYETAVYVKNQILTNAGISILAQANMLPQQALSLLG
jgi:flagellin